jgi:hypothetical protein
MHRPTEAAMLAELLRAALGKVVDAADVCGGQPIKVLPRTFPQVESIVRVCTFHRVAWSLESSSTMDANLETANIDVVVVLPVLTASSRTFPEIGLSFLLSDR